MKSNNAIMIFLFFGIAFSFIGCKTKELARCSLWECGDKLKYGYYDRNDKKAEDQGLIIFLIGPKYKFAYDFTEGTGCVQQWEDHKFGYINEKDEFVIEPVYDDAEPFYGGIAPVKINKKWGFIDKTGKIVIEPKYDEVQTGFLDNTYFLNGKCSVKMNEKWGLINERGVFIVEPIYDGDEIYHIWKSWSPE